MTDQRFRTIREALRDCDQFLKERLPGVDTPRGEIELALQYLDTLERGVEQALEVASSYGMTDGAYHKQWVLDQVVRALVTPERYKQWVVENGGIWEEGIAP